MVELQSLRFFESGDVLPDVAQRQYAAQFPKSTTRFVSFQVDVQNRLWELREHRHPVAWRYYRPDGSVLGQADAEWGMPPELQDCHYSSGWGWREAGHWPLGVYRVEVLLDGQQLAEEQFTIYADRDIEGLAQNPFELQSLRFFESGDVLPDVAQRQYAARFPQSTTRFVNFQVDVQNRLWGVREHTHKVIGRYYCPDGSVLGQADGEWGIPPGLKEIWYSHGQGWKEAGHWPLGVYRVEVLLDGQQLAEGQFTIYADHTAETLAQNPLELQSLQTDGTDGADVTAWDVVFPLPTPQPVSPEGAYNRSAVKSAPPPPLPPPKLKGQRQYWGWTMLGLFGICMSTWKFTKQSDDAHGGTMVPVVLAPTLPPAARRPAWRSPAARRWGLVVVMSLVLLALGLWALPPKPSPGPPFTTEQQRRLLEQQRLREAQQHLAKDKRELEEERQRPKVTKPRAQPQVAGKAWRNSIGMEFVLIPTGTFQMGANDQDVYNDAQPVHQVRISKPFYLGKYEVTQEQWRTIMGNNPSRFKGAPRLPVENVSWEEVQEFIRQLNAKEGGWKYRLPTEAEWEYAGRAGTTTAYSFGDDAHQVGEYAWHGENSSGKTHPVGQKKPNPWGLYDMHGNVWEWVQDWYGPYTAGAAVDPAGPSSGSHRVYRGGSWGHSAKGCRSAFRSNLPPGLRYAYLGFRLLRTAE